MTCSEYRSKADMEVVERLKKNPASQADFKQLYERYAPATFAFFMRKVGDPATAADLNQDLFLRLSRSIARFEGRCSWRTWVFIVARTVLSESRSRWWKQLGDRTVELDPEAFSEALQLDSDPDEQARAVLLRERLRRCMRGLSEKARAVIIGHYFAGVTLRELTERLQFTNPSGSRAVLLGALRKLKRCLEGEVQA